MLKVTEVKSAYKLLKDTIPIGYGTTAICFLTRDNNVIKYYLPTPNKKEMFAKRNMLETLTFINSIQNNTYVGPEEVFMKDDEVIGYKYPYIEAPTIKNLSNNTTLFEIYNHYEELLKDTKDISDKHFRLHDVHYKNILFNNYYYVIDLDKGREDNERVNLLRHNTDLIKETMMEKLFLVRPWEVMFFEEEKLQEVYNYTRWFDDESVFTFYEALARSLDDPNPSIKRLRRIPIRKERNCYYKYN